jgi:F-type H+-transporting ATPase subunit delta
MLAQQVAKVYGHALFDLAKEANLLDKAWEQFDSLAEYLKKDSAFLDFMAAPQILDSHKTDLIKKVFGSHLEKPFLNFLMILTEKHRINFLSEIIDEFDRLVRAEKGVVRATCITTAPLTEDERKQMIKQLIKKTSFKIELEEKIDKSIIGGVILILHNQIIDDSIRYHLGLLKNRLMRVKVH